MKIKLQLLDISADDLETDDNHSEFVVTLYGKSNEKSDKEDFNKNIVCHITGFRPYIYLRVPRVDSNNKNIPDSFYKKSWFKERFLNINKYLHNISEIKDYYELYRFRSDNDGNELKYKFIKLEFISYDDMKKVIKLIKDYCKYNQENTESRVKSFIDLSNEDPEYRFDCNLYESNIHPILRFIHEKDLKTSGWVEINVKKEVLEKRFNCDHEYNININDLTTEGVTDEGINKFIIASFDIECDSSHGDFPNPVKDLRKLCIEITDYHKILSIDTIDTIKSIFKKAFCEKHREKYETDNSFDDIISPVYSDYKYSQESLDQVMDKYSSQILELLKNSETNSKSRDLCVKELTSFFSEIKAENKNKLIVKGDPIIQIGTVFHKYGDSEPYDRSLVVMGSEYVKVEEICDDLENMKENNINIYRCNSERELLLKWKDLMLKHNPDYVTGYNIFGFDFDYIIKRVDVLFKCTYGCFVSKWKTEHKPACDKHQFYRLGRMMKDNTNDHESSIDLDKAIVKKLKVNSDYKCHTNKICKDVVKKLGGFNDKSDSDFAQNTLKYIHMDGRIIFDVQNEVKKGTSLDSYKLDNVAAHFMRGKIKSKNTFKRFNQTRIITDNCGNLKENDYLSILITTKYGDIKYNNNEKFKILQIEESKDKLWEIRVSGVIKNYEKKYGDNYIKAEWCLNKDDVPPQELFRLHKFGGPAGRAKIAKYCIMDCELCIYLLLSQDFIPNNMGMSNVCYVPQTYIFLRGQGIKVQSLMTYYCSKDGIRVPTLKQFNEEESDNSGFEGAIVLDPKTGMYLDDPISVLDYASLYPTSIKEKNLSHNTYLGEYEQVKDKLDNLGWKEIEDYNRIKYLDYEYINKPGTTVVEKKPVMIEKINEKGETIETHKEIDCVFLTPKKKRGIVPLVTSELLSARKRTKKLLAAEKDESKKKVLDGYQLAYKLTANSVYGQLGAKTSSISFKKIAACTTAIGRNRIYDARRLVVKWADDGIWRKYVGNNEFYNGITNISSEVIYGDTDSVFVKFIIEKGDGIIIKGKDALPICIQCGKDSGTYITEQLHVEDKAPQDLEYEKTFYPFILISKKRYTGEKYEFTADETPKRTSMGLVTKRRDNAPIVKYVFGNLITKLMYDKDINKTLDWLKYILKRIIDGKEHISQFILSKTLNSYYKNPGSIAHKVLADRIGERDPGNKPKANDRIPYAYIKVDDESVPTGEYYKKDDILNMGFFKNGKPKTKKIRVDDHSRPKVKKKVILQGDRIEHPDYIKENKKKLDYKFYISNQIMNPVRQVLDILMTPEKSKELFNIFLQ